MKGRLDINLNHFRSMSSAAVELHLLSLVESAGGILEHLRIHLRILNQHIYRSMPLSCAWGKDNKERALSDYKEEWHE